VNSEQLQSALKTQEKEINDWYIEKLNYLKEHQIPLPIYSSCDIRDSGYKASIVDSNAFPSGFNNLDSVSRDFASDKFLDYLTSISQKKNILIITENHTRNTFYFSNINTLSEILTQAGFKTFLGSIEEESSSHSRIATDSNGESLKIEKIFRNGNSIYTQSFRDGIIFLNNDLSLNHPKILDDIHQPILPSALLGWYSRKKSNHFHYYNKYIEELTSLLSIDPWLLGTIYTSIDGVNFKEKNSLHDVADAVDMVINNISQKYVEYNIHDKPFVFVKNNSGTYGLGIINATSGTEIMHLNSKNRKKMIYGKGRTPIKSVIIQEGIYTKYTLNNSSAEPVLYSVGGNVIGGFMRVNKLQDKSKNLNTRGMSFEKIIENDLTRSIILKNGEFSLYSLLTRISDLALAREYQKTVIN
jgi:glutamate--cysteine ligase